MATRSPGAIAATHRAERSCSRRRNVDCGPQDLALPPHPRKVRDDRYRQNDDDDRTCDSARDDDRVQPDVMQTVAPLQDRTKGLSASIRNLSLQLVPSVLLHAGLVATLRRHCRARATA